MGYHIGVVLPSPLSMHPVDLLFGETIPQVQCYAVCGPAREVTVAGVGEVLGELLPERFGRLCYELPRRVGLIRQLRLAPTGELPISEVSFGEASQQVGELLDRGLDDRHWHLVLVSAPEALIPVLLFDHFLCHGHTARQLLLALNHRLHGRGTEVTEASTRCFRQLQDELVDRARGAAPWAAYRRVDMPSAPLRELARTLDLPFTEAAMLWLARTVHDVAVRERPMEIISFRMDGGVDPESPSDPAYGNAGLQALLWEMLPDGFYSAMDPSLGLGNRNLEEFVAFYRRFPFKGALTWLLRRGIEKGKRDHHRQDREKLVLNNLGDSPVPFFRSMFFDPFNDADHLGLVFVDSSQGELMLQFSPPRQYLEVFDWSRFERRLHDNLVTMQTEPRVRTREPIRAPSPR
jgi:hypothetical protein